MDLHNPYEVEFLREDRAEHIAKQVKQYRGTNEDHPLTLVGMLSAVVILGTLLNLIVGQ
jgi:hypothetical protein